MRTRPDPIDCERAERMERIRAQLRRNELPREWREELGYVDGDTVMLMFWLDTLARRGRAAHLNSVRIEGLSYSEATVLYTLLLAGPPYRESPTRINEDLDLTSGGVTKTVDRLEAQGFVERLPDDADGRSIRVGLTESGADVARRIARGFAKRYDELVGPLDARQRRLAVEVVRELLDAFDGPL